MLVFGMNILKMTKIELSVVLPVFNEEKNIPKVVSEFLKMSRKVSLEIIFVEDGGSKDKTREFLKENSKKYKFVKSLFIKKKGYGNSLFEGLKYSKGEFVGWTHADLQTNPYDTIRALEIIKKEKNPQKIYVKGKRYGRPIFDRFFTTGMSFFESFLLKTRLWDINAQPNIFHKSFLDLIKTPPKDFSFDLYTYYIAKINKYKFIRFPVYFGKRSHGKSAWNYGLYSKIRFIIQTITFSFKLKKLIK